MARTIDDDRNCPQLYLVKFTLLFFLLNARVCHGVWPFSGGVGDHVGHALPTRSPRAIMKSQGSLPHFEVEGGSGKELAEQYARQNGLIEAGNDCRQRAYAELQRSCREIMQVGLVCCDLGLKALLKGGKSLSFPPLRRGKAAVKSILLSSLFDFACSKLQQGMLKLGRCLFKGGLGR